jgi:hypothetical protein
MGRGKGGFGLGKKAAAVTLPPPRARRSPERKAAEPVSQPAAAQGAAPERAEQPSVPAVRAVPSVPSVPAVRAVPAVPSVPAVRAVPAVPKKQLRQLCALVFGKEWWQHDDKAERLKTAKELLGCASASVADAALRWKQRIAAEPSKRARVEEGSVAQPAAGFEAGEPPNGVPAKRSRLTVD